MDYNTVIAVFCYKRPAKLKASIEALLKNPECSEMDIIFFCDGHKNEQDFQAVQETRAYIRSIRGFKKIYTHFKEKNVSTGPNFRDGITYLFQNFDQFIVVEDDLVVTPNYIKYMLDALHFYKSSNHIFCITGFCFPLNAGNYPYDTFIYNRFSSYGWASWSNRIKGVIWDNKELSHLMKTSPGFKDRLNEEGLDLYRMLQKQIKGTISTWDIQMQVHVAENKFKVVYPVIAKGANIGFDNESTNTFGIDYLKTPQDDGSKRSFNFCNPELVEPELIRQIKRPYRLPALAARKIINTIIKLTNKVKKAS